MKKDVVLVVGSGGKNKMEYLRQLERLGASVVLLEPSNIQYDFPQNYEIHDAPFTNLDAVIEKGRQISSRHSLVAVDTVFEPALEHAASLRQDLGLGGLTPELVKIGRRKTAMARFLSTHDIRTAPFVVFNGASNLQEIKAKMECEGNTEWVIRPDNLASNIGVRKFRRPDDIDVAFENAQEDIRHHQFLSSLFDAPSKWIASRFIQGYELEAEVCIHKGKIIFLCPFLKTIIFEQGWRIEENRCVTPVPWLPHDELEDMHLQIQRLAGALYQEIMKPCGRNTMIVYVELRLDKDRHAYVLEFAFRNGGYLNPLTIEMSTGINPYSFSACATLGFEPEIKQRQIRCAAGYQSIYSDRKGRYEGVSDIENVQGISVQNEVPAGYEISVPHSEMVMNVMATAPSPEDVDSLLNRALRNAKVIVDGESCRVPLSTFVE